MGVNMKFDTDLLPQYAGRHRKTPSSQRTARRLARRTALVPTVRETAGRAEPETAHWPDRLDEGD
jgi:hypothetical protein